MIIDVAVGIIVNATKHILVSRRPKHVPQGGLWEFPGGKLERAEDSYAALCRELKEEVNVDVKAACPLLKVQQHYPENKVKLHVWQVLSYSGVACGMEGQQIKWILVDHIQQLKFPTANIEIIRFLQQNLL